MSGKFFLDSNILVYCLDENNSEKQSIAKKIITNLVETSSGQISTQSLQEFFNVITKKMKCTKRKCQTVS